MEEAKRCRTHVHEGGSCARTCAPRRGDHEQFLRTSSRTHKLVLLSLGRTKKARKFAASHHSQFIGTSLLMYSDTN